MERVGVLVVSKCLSASAIVDTLMRSEKYAPELYVIEKQLNPFNKERAKVHRVVPDLNIGDVVGAAGRFKGRVAFGLTDTEDFITAGGRDALEREAGIPMVCVTKEYALEGSKARQRILFDHIFKGANPRYEIFDPKSTTAQTAVTTFKKTLSDFGSAVIKPDAPARGAGVGVWGSDFRTEKEAVAFFLGAFEKGKVVVEERVEGEESSFHAFSDGRHFLPSPMTRDYKRSLENDRGALTGGMGSYRGASPHLPFVNKHDLDRVYRAEEAAFRRWKGRGSNPGLRGVVLYDAIMHTKGGFKVLERNSRGGNTELICLLTTLADDFVEVCFRTLDGTLKGLTFRRQASVVTCAVPLSYGKKDVQSAEGGSIGLSGAYRMVENSSDSVRVYPMDVRLKNGAFSLGTSRSAAIVGLGPTVEAARQLSLRACRTLIGPLRWRQDIASSRDIKKSLNHLRRIRASA